ncbi:ABC transporter permease [Paenibacillus flagellatus]|uniref:ABC transporter permease n=1 Tax=Paenibacillus flagellatus TaxID=2211139 RepID=A0A2V5KQQ7_9BACL|nr:FtsX-like permease family protein [Paenibacillus flagellatus]PYI51046.1 hypothetical protein DLM86_27155 [Paenibacillus flagellatus]
MKSYAGLIPRYLRHQRRRTLLTAAGITLSVALLTFMTLFVVNLKEINFRTAERVYGSYHVRFIGSDERQADTIRLHPSVRTSGALLTADVPSPVAGTSVSLFAVENDGAASMLPLTYVQGKAPERADEVALAEWALTAMRMEPRLGQTIEAGGRSFRLVGIMSNPKSTWIDAKTAGAVVPETLLGLARGPIERSVYVRFHDRLVEGPDDVYTRSAVLRDAAGIGKTALNHNDGWIEAYGSYKGRDLPSLAIVLVDAAATVIAIYNMFHLSVLEKLKQFGILRAIGMNARQLRRLIIGEALLLCAVSIPAGIALGWGALQAAASFVFEGSPAPALVTPWTVPALAAAVGLATVLLAALRPAIVAGRVSPLEALREAAAGSRPPSGFRAKPGRAYGRWLGLAGLLAHRSVSRGKSRFAVTVLSMSVAIALFVGVHYFVSIQDPAASIRHQFLWGADYYLSAGSNREGRGFDEADLASVRAIEGVRDVFPTRISYGYTYLAPDRLTPDFRTILDGEQDYLANPRARDGSYTTMVKAYFYSDELLDKAESYLIDGRIDKERLARGEDMLLIQSGDEPKTLLKAGDTIELGHMQLVDGPRNDNWSYAPDTRTVRIGGVVKKFPQVGAMPEGLHAVGHERFYESFSGGTLYRKIDVRLDERADRAAAEDALKRIAKSNNGQFVSFERKKEQIRAEFDQATRLLYAFIAIVTAIGALSIVNTMTTHFVLRTKEFGVMRAIGMSERQLRKMVRTEGLLYALHSGFWGALLGVGSTWAVYRFLSAEFPDMVPVWRFPWLSVALALAGTTAIILLSAILPLRRLNRLAIVDSIRHVE